MRLHNQGYSNSCVGQTLSTIAEIDAKEHGLKAPRSAGYIYDQINGGRDGGATYEAAFHVLTHQGDATLKAFPHDGQDWWVQPGPSAWRSASKDRFSTWRSIRPWDRHTIEAELHAGRAIAFAIPVRDTFYYWNGRGVMSSDTGAYHFDHSITAYGYTPQGLRVLNSWGPGWGVNGTVIMSWQLVARDTTEMIASIPQTFAQKPAKHHQKPHKPRRNHQKPPNGDDPSTTEPSAETRSLVTMLRDQL